MNAWEQLCSVTVALTSSIYECTARSLVHLPRVSDSVQPRGRTQEKAEAELRTLHTQDLSEIESLIAFDNLCSRFEFPASMLIHRCIRAFLYLFCSNGAGYVSE